MKEEAGERERERGLNPLAAVFFLNDGRTELLRFTEDEHLNSVFTNALCYPHSVTHVI